MPKEPGEQEGVPSDHRRGDSATEGRLRRPHLAQLPDLPRPARAWPTPAPWMQSIAQDWLIFDLTHSSAAVGVTMALQFGPILLLGLHAGMVADRLSKRRILLITQTLNAVGHRGTGRHHLAGAVRAADVYVFALLSGLIFAFDGPARQAFVTDVVPRRPAPRGHLAERRGVPGDPARRAGPRQRPHRVRGHRMGVRGQRRLLPRPDRRPAACCGRPTCSPAPPPPAAARSPRAARDGRRVRAAPPGDPVDDLPRRHARHVRPQLPDRAHRDGEVGVRRRREHVRPVQHRPRARLGGRRGARRGAARQAADPRDRALRGAVRRPPGRRGVRAGHRRVRRAARRHGPGQPDLPGDGQLGRPARRRPGDARPRHGALHAGLHRRHAHRRAHRRRDHQPLWRRGPA